MQHAETTPKTSLTQLELGQGTKPSSSGFEQRRHPGQQRAPLGQLLHGDIEEAVPCDLEAPKQAQETLSLPDISPRWIPSLEI